MRRGFGRSNAHGGSIPKISTPTTSIFAPHMASVMPTDAGVSAGLLKDALRLGRDYAADYALLAWCHVIFFARDGLNEADKVAGIRYERAANADGGDDHTALAIAAFALGTLSKDYDAAAGPIERALSLNPSCAAAHYIGAIVYAFRRPSRRRNRQRQSCSAAHSTSSLRSPMGAGSRGNPRGAL
jgi:hypothetical protein